MISTVCQVVSALSLTFAFVVLLMHATMTPACAYLDPTAATFLMQAVAGAFLAAGLAVKRYWTFIKMKLGFAPKKSEKVDEQ